MITNSFSDPQIAAKKAGDDLSLKLSDLKRNNCPVLLLVSGGSSFEILKYVSRDALFDKITIGALDERYDQTNRDNNFTHLTKTDFYRAAKKNNCQFIDTAVKKGQSQAQLARFFSNRLKLWKKNNRQDVILATVGMGQDGHIAGIMPFPESPKKFDRLFNDKKIIAAYNAAGKNICARRVTTTITFLKTVNRAFAYICGQDKAAAFKKIGDRLPINELPVQALKHIKNVTIYTDII